MRLPLEPRGRKSPARVVLLLALLSGGLVVPGPALGAPEYATPDPGSPAGTEYGLPFQQGRGAGGDGPSNFGGPVGSGSGGSGGSGGPGGGAVAGGTGGAAGAGSSASTAGLFGAGITPPGRSAGSSDPSSSGRAARSGRDGAGSDGGAAGLSARAVADIASARSSTADGQVALIAIVLLGGAAALAVVLRLVGRRSPPAGVS